MAAKKTAKTVKTVKTAKPVKAAKVESASVVKPAKTPDKGFWNVATMIVTYPGKPNATQRKELADTIQQILAKHLKLAVVANVDIDADFRTEDLSDYK